MSEIKDELAKRASSIKNRDAGEGMETSGTGYETDHQKMSVRLLRAEEIECRVSTINERGLSLLLFKDARVDQKILDETFTPFGWKRTHQIIDGNLYCTVEIWDGEKGQWIAKQDVGTTSYSEKEKGQASDSFKRACFNWGIGRELYTAPFIWVPAEKVSIQKKGDRYVTSDRFSVRSIAYNAEREIAALVIVNGKGCKVYEMKPKVYAGQKEPDKPKEGSVKESDKPEENTRQNPLVGQSASGMQNMSGETNGFDRKKEASGITDMQRAALQKELKKENDTSAGERFLDAVRAYREGFQFGDTDTRRLLLSSIVERVTIDGRSVKVHWRI